MAGERWEAVKAWGLRAGMCLAVLPFFYVLSVGPVVRWYERRALQGTLTAGQEAAVEEFYAPLEYAYDNCPPLAWALDWYMDLWSPY